MTDSKRIAKGVVAGVAGGMVASWAMNRFYDLARESAHASSMWPYAIGAGIGATYATVIQRRRVPLAARVPLSAAIWLGEPEKAADPLRGGRNLSEKTQNLAARIAAKGLKKVAEKALFA